MEAIAVIIILIVYFLFLAGISLFFAIINSLPIVIPVAIMAAILGTILMGILIAILVAIVTNIVLAIIAILVLGKKIKKLKTA